MFSMATITVNIPMETEKMFRETVYRKLGKRKGSLGRALDEAMKKWTEEKQQKEIRERQLKLLAQGLHMGKILIKHRSELYDR